jgi:cellulose synthase/poly-beta-1,6-N-acetylglucosamine synthase-like glycosyltransferase
VLWIAAVGSTLILYWIYDGYGRFLQLIGGVWSGGGRPAVSAVGASLPTESLPTVTVLLTVHNEERVVRRRIENLLACDYPAARFKVLIASDGSTDATNEIVRSFGDSRVRLLESPGLGKTATQNLAMKQIDSELVVFTDADVEFELQWVRRVVRCFQDIRVGAVDGRLYYGRPTTADVQACEGHYWRYEMKLRDLESRLGILAVLSGCCFAMRRALFVEMDPAIGEDCIVPLDIVCGRHLVVHEPTALVYDEFGNDSAVTLRRRIRMTLRNWQGTWTRSQLLNPFRHPGYAFALWSHKILRWLSPVFLLTATLTSAALLVVQPSLASLAMFGPFAGLFLLAGCHWLADGRRRILPGSGTAYSFVLANLAFIIGVWRAVTGQQIRAYRNS